MEMKELLRTLCTSHGVAGAEEGAVAAARRFMEPFASCRVTPLGSLVCTVKPAREGRPHILLDGHIDEIGLIVTCVMEDGFVKVGACGGIDRRLLPASQVTIHGRGGPVKAVVCSVPPHLREGDGKKVGKIESFTLDCGLTTENARERVAPGDRVTFDAPFVELLGGLVSCKSLDDRAGCAAVMRAGELLHGDGPDIGITVLLSTMEEVGGQGAGTAAFAAAPTHAVAVDVSFAKCEGAPKAVTADVGSGPMIGFAPILSREMSEGLVRAAQRHNIAYTCEVMARGTGTNADQIAVSRGGVRTALVSIPQRNMHTPVEVVSAADVEAVAQLLAAYVRDNF